MSAAIPPSTRAAAMKVLHVIPSVSPVHGGPSHAIGLMERALGRLGVSVQVATTDDDGPGARRVEPAGAGQGTRRYFRKRTEFYKVAPSMLPWLRRVVPASDVVHVHGLFSFTSIAAAWAARRAGVPFVVRPLGSLARYGVQRRRPLLKRLSLALFERRLLSAAAAVHFTSEAERIEADELGIPMRAAVLPLGVEVPPEVARAEKGDPSEVRLLCLARLDPKKNIDGLVQALALLADRGLRPRLAVAGTGAAAEADRLRSLAQRLGVDERIDWLGHVQAERKSELLAAADVFVLPSFTENFGIAAAEALAAGLPCVLGEGVALAAAVEQAGAGVAVRPVPEAIADGLQRYIGSAAARRAAGSAARELALREYSSDRMGRDLLRLYERVIATAGAPAHG